MVKNLPEMQEATYKAGDPGSIPGLGKFPVEGYGDPLQYSCLGNRMEREAWWATSVGLQESDTAWQLNHHHYQLAINLV